MKTIVVGNLSKQLVGRLKKLRSSGREFLAIGKDMRQFLSKMHSFFLKERLLLKKKE